MQTTTLPNMTVCALFSSFLINANRKKSLISVNRRVLSPPVGKWAVEQLKENKVPGDQGLVLKSRAKHHAISAMLSKPFTFQDQPLVLQ